MSKKYNYTDEALKDWSDMLSYFDLSRTDVWKILGYKSQGGYDTKLTNMKKKGKLTPELQLAVDIWKTMASKKIRIKRIEFLRNIENMEWDIADESTKQ